VSERAALDDAIVVAFDRHDLEATAGYTVDVVVEDSEGRTLVGGRVELRARHGGMFAVSADRRSELAATLALAEHVVDDERIEARSPEPRRLVAVDRVSGNAVVRRLVLR